MPKLKQSERAEIEALLRAETPVFEIAARFGVDRRSVSRIKQRMAEQKDETRAQNVTAFRLSDAEAERLDRLVRTTGYRSRSDVLRALVRIATGYFEADDEVVSALRQIESNLARDGNNLNQIARAMALAQKKGDPFPYDPSLIDSLHAQRDGLRALKSGIGVLLRRAQERAAQIAARLEGGLDGSA